MKVTSNITAPQRQALALATVIALLFGAYFLRHYFTLIVFAAIMAFLFNPIYQKRYHKTGKAGSSAAITFVVAMILILIPLFLILLLTGVQINGSLKTVQSNVSTSDISNAANHLIDSANNLLAKTPTDFRVTAEWIQTTLTGWAQAAGTAILDSLKSYATSVLSFFTTAIIFIFVFLSLLKNQQILLETIRRLNPLGENISDLYVERISAMTKAMVRGQFIIAFLQGLTDAALIYIGGFHSAFFLILMVMVALSFIPLGGGILAIPIGIIMALSGNLAGGLVVIIGHLIIVTNIDNILRPRLVPPEAKLDSALTILSVFSGIALLGFLGIVVGPVIMITIVTTISVYLEVYRDVEMKTFPNAEKHTKTPLSGWLNRTFRR